MRQTRDKTPKSKRSTSPAKRGGPNHAADPATPKNPENDPALIELKHQHIPQDAKGDPVYLILPQGLRRTYDSWMANLEAFWLATEDPSAVGEAHTLTLLYRQVSPPWLDVAVHSLAEKRRTKKHAKAVRERFIRSARYMAVRDAKACGLTWDEAYAAAERECASNPVLAGSADTMRRAYLAVTADRKAGRLGLYFLPHKQNAIAREALKAGRLVLTRAEREVSARPKGK